jgi:hypothetical protein
VRQPATYTVEHTLSHVQPAKSLRNPRIELALLAILLICYTYIMPRWADWSQNSRLDLVLAIVDGGTLSVDRYYQNTGDYAYFEGHYYLDKAPGPALLGVPVYAAVRPLLHAAPAQRLLERLAHSPAFAGTLKSDGSGLLADKLYQAVVLYILTILLVSIPAAVLGVLLYRLLGLFAIGQGWRVAAVLLYALGTSALPYAGAFYSHQLVAFLLFGAFYVGYGLRHLAMRKAWSIVAGFMLGLALISEYPAALIAAPVALYILAALPTWRWRLGLLAAGAPPLALLMAYDWAIFHTVLPAGYHYSALWQGQHSAGLFSLTYPHPDALWGITFGPMRGLFYVAPVLLLAVAGLLAWPGMSRARGSAGAWTSALPNPLKRVASWRWVAPLLQPEFAVCAWATLSFMLFNGSSAMWQGGYGVGPRYVVPMLPFLAAGLGAYAARWGHAWPARLLAIVAGAWSVAVVWAETLGGQNYPDWSPVPLLQYTLPNLAANNIARNLGMALGLRGWASLAPLALCLLLAGAVIWRELRAGAGAESHPDGFANVSRTSNVGLNATPIARRADA